MQQEPRPAVTLTASSAPAGATPPPGVAPSRSRWSRAVLLLPVAAVAVALVAGSPEREPPAPPAPSVDARLAVLPDAISVSTTGVLVVPVELSNGGAAVRVERALAYASPVVHDAVVQAPDEVPAAGRRRFVALLAPDCRLLRPGSTVGFTASVLLRVEQGSVAQDLVVDLSTPAVLRIVRGLCGAD